MFHKVMLQIESYMDKLFMECSQSSFFQSVTKHRQTDHLTIIKHVCIEGVYSKILNIISTFLKLVTIHGEIKNLEKNLANSAITETIQQNRSSDTKNEKCTCRYYHYPRKLRGKTHSKNGKPYMTKRRDFVLGCPVHDKSLIFSDIAFENTAPSEEEMTNV